MLLEGCQDVVGHLEESFDFCPPVSLVFPYVQFDGQAVIGHNPEGQLVLDPSLSKNWRSFSKSVWKAAMGGNRL